MLRACLAVLAVGLVLAAPARSDETADTRVDQLVENLAHADESVRHYAAKELGRIGPAASKAEAQLVAALSDSDELVRSAAADSLLRLGADANLILPLLKDKKARLAVIESLLALRQEAALVAPALIEIRAQRDRSIGSDFFGVDNLLRAFNPDLSSRLQMALFESLDDADERRANAACECIEELGRLELASVPALIELLKSPRRTARISGARLLKRLGPVAHRAEPALRTLSTDPYGEVSLTAYAALGAVAGDDEAMRSVAAALTSDDPQMRLLALDLLGKPGPQAAGAARSLRLAITDEKLPEDFRRSCVDALLELGPAAIPELIRGIEQCRDEAVLALAVHRLFGPAAAAAPDALARRLRDVEQESTRVDIMQALGSIGPLARGAIPAVLEKLERGSAHARATAAETLGKIGVGNGELRPRLARLLNDESAEVRAHSCVALLLVGADSDSVMPSRLELINEDDLELCVRTLSALEAAGPNAKAAIPKLIEALGYEADERSAAINLTAGSCLEAIGPAAVPHLAEALGRDQARVRVLAAQSLGQIGPEAKSAVKALVEVLDDERTVPFFRGCMGFQRAVGQTAMRALGQIGPGAEAAVPELVRQLERELPLDESTFSGNPSYLIEALRGIGKPARAAVPLLEKSLQREANESEAAVTSAVLAALLRIAPDSPAAIPETRRYLHWIAGKGSNAWYDEAEYGNMLDAIVAVGQPGQALLPDLIELCSTRPVVNVSTRCQAARAALRLDPGCQPALRCLRWMSHHRDTSLRAEAEEELKKCEKGG